jgi:predicted PurR-regulated permease PerM
VIVLAGTVLSVVVVGCLYWAQSIFIPVAMAVFLTFLLSPLVSFLQRKGVGRVPAVIGVMLLTVVLLGGLVYLISMQLGALVSRLPQYSDKVQAKVQPITARVERLNRSFGQLFAPQRDGIDEEPADVNDKPPAVVVKPAGPPWASRLPEMLAPAAHGLGGAALAVVLTGFMLLKREDLRNRLIRLAGRANVTVATRALDETGARVSRFLVMQAIICAATGATIGLGLLVLGVPYALLWGFLVFLLRYVPYVGIWFAALPPILLSLATSDGWAQPLAVVGLIFVVEMIAGNVAEPWLYGRSMGVSEVALLVAAAFWAFLWGPIGMVLSSPMTVCLAVLGKYYPRLKFLDVLLGDEPALDPDVSFYQRLLARDQDEATQIVSARLEQGVSREEATDELLVRTLCYLKHDRDRDEISDDDELAMLEAIREIGEDMAGKLGASCCVPAESFAKEGAESTARASLVGYAADSAEDETALHLLAGLVGPNAWETEVCSSDVPGSELLAKVSHKHPDLICVAALQPTGLAHVRRLCKRLRAHFPAAKILVARWGPGALSDQQVDQLKQSGADVVTGKLTETLRQIQDCEAAPCDTQHDAAPRREAETVAV